MWHSYLEGRSRDALQVSTQSASLDGLRAVEKRVLARKIAKIFFA